MRPQLIGDEIHMDAQLVGILVPHAAPGPVEDFRTFMDEATTEDERDLPEPVEYDTDTAEQIAEAIAAIPMIGGMVPMKAVQDALASVKDNA